RWYRYHHLFLELLRHRLQQSLPDKLPVLHGRASAWFEAQNRLDEAIHHALAAQDYERAAVLLEKYVSTSTWIRQNMDQLLNWFAGLPAVLFSTRPRLALGYAWLLFEIYADRWLDIETLLQQAEHALATPAIASRLREPETRRLMAEVALLRANHARFRGDTAQVIEHCRQALARLPEDERFVRSGVTAHLAAAHESRGDLTQAADLYRESIRMCKAANNADGLLFAAARLITIAPARGLLHQAESVFHQVQALSPARTGPDMGMVYVAIGDVYREQNQVEMAQRCLAKGIELCRAFPAWRAGVAAGNLALARLAAAQDDHSVALDCLADAEQAVAASGPQEIARQIEALRARLLLDQGHISSAIAWGRAHQKDTMAAAAGAGTTVQLAERLTLIRILLAQAVLAARGVRTAALVPDPLATAAQLLADSYGVARAGGHQGTLIEIKLLQAQIDHAAAEMEQALAAVEEALILAAPEGYVQIFLDEEEPVRGLLTMLAIRATGT
ncbi:MAG: hypothetical protein H3C34_29660, partial [Caldilineaceae bacterium]|nr:hypothetical protein [Caldilineaceae bacterium]